MASTPATPPFPHEEIWRDLRSDSLFSGEWHLFRHDDLTRMLHDLGRRATVPLHLGQAGLSEEGCALHTVRFGTGNRRVLIWARQHGDEPDCSAGLAMALDTLLTAASDPWRDFLLGRLQLLVLPMVNPDGVARFTRQNAQGLDLNRDAVALASAESQALVTLKHSFEPEYCFNLHDMSPRKTTEKGRLVAMALQAGPFEERDIDNETRLKAKAVCGIIAREAEIPAPGHIARYTADYMPRAFGDSMMRWGVSSILIEAGGWFPGRGGDEFVRRLFALALLRALHAIASEEDAAPTGELYDGIPFDGGAPYCDLLLRGGELANGTGRPSFPADLAINRQLARSSTGGLRHRATIAQMGDLGDQRAFHEVEASGKLLLPGMIIASPGFRPAGGLPADHELLPFLRAGITTLACGFGPFEDGKQLDQWLAEALLQQPLINLLAFERVDSLETVRRRHGLTKLAGLLVSKARILPEDLLEFAQLHHPSHHVAIEPAHLGNSLCVEIFFRGGASPESTRMHLHLSPASEDETSPFLVAHELLPFCQEFIESSSRLTFGFDPVTGSPHWLPLLLSPCGLDDGRAPDGGHFARVLRDQGRGDETRLLNALNLLHARGISTFLPEQWRRFMVDGCADVVVLPGSIWDNNADPDAAAPDLVVVNGCLSHDATKAANGGVTPGAGSFLAGAPHEP